MLKELLVETVVLAIMAVIAHFMGWQSVKLIDRPRGTRVVRKAARTKHATALREQFRRRNKWSEVETESLISLPSVSFNWTIGTIVGTVMTVLLTVNHVNGMVEIGRSSEHAIIYDYIIALGIFYVIGLLIAGWIAEKVIPDAAQARARKIAHKRVLKGRSIRFSQRRSIDELIIETFKRPK